MTSAVMASFAGTELSLDEAKVLKKLCPAGVSLFRRNIVSPQQLSKLTSSLKELLGEDLLIAVDQEGGRVRRLAEPYWRSYASQYTLGLVSDNICEMHAELIAEDLHACGINFNYAPVLDTCYPETHPVLKSRCFTGNVSQKGKIMAETYCRNGICPCIKHLPGHGRTQTDPHLGLPIINCSLKDYQKDMQPFIDNNRIPAGMTAHIVLPEVDEGLPITMSACAIDKIIRGKIGFSGLLISDAVDMKALSGSLEEKTTSALRAGCDLVCYCSGNIDDLLKLASLNIQITSACAERLDKIKQIIRREQKDFADYQDYQRAMDSIPPYADTYDATEVLNLMQKK